MATLLLLSTGCIRFAPQATVTAIPTPTDYPPDTETLLTFVEALNNQDYAGAFNLIDQESQVDVKDATHLQQAYENARYTATANQVSYTLLGGLLARGTHAVTLLIGSWQTSLLGTFDTTSTLTLTVQNGNWRVVWTPDLIVPGLSNGVLTLKRNTPQRGSINIADGTTLAAQSEGVTIGVRQSEIKSSAEESAMLDVLSKLTELSPAQVKARYKDKPAAWFVPIANVDETTLAQYSDALSVFDAVSAEPNYNRAYLQSDIAPHVIGYVGPIPPEQQDQYRQRGYTGDELIGLSGVEGAMDGVLAGSPGGELQLIDTDGATTVIASKAFTPSRDITLSISPTVQLNAQKLLGARRGAVIAMVPTDGSIVAMASYPTFDNAIVGQSANQNARQRLMSDPAKPLLNRATQGLYPPGSTFKMVTMAAGMGEGVTFPADVFIDPGYWDGLGSAYRKTCWLRSGHGRITLQDGLTASCDVVFYNVGKRLDDKGADLLSQYGKRFGFGTPTGVELTGEAAGLMPDPEWKQQTTGDVWTSGDTVNLAIGQGFMLATPLQVAQMTASIANAGKIVRPHVVAEIEARDPLPAQMITGTLVGTIPLNAEGLQAEQKGMMGVTTNARIGTTTFRFNDFDYYIVNGQIVPGKLLDAKQRGASVKFVVAGKSGTAQAPGAQDKPFAWFTAYAPADNPQIVVTAMLENAGEGSVVAAPLVRQMIEAYFGLPVSGTPKDIQVTD